jgi:type I restriction enzyme, S subunit
MKQAWPLVKLGEVLQQVSRQELVDPLREYTTLGVKWYAQGLFAKDKLMGHQIAAPKIYRVEEGDFVYNRLFAWKGSFAVADNSVSSCYVSNEFPCFRSIESRLDVRYLHVYFRQEHSWSSALGLSSGATPTSRNRLKESAFLSLKVPLPPIKEQKLIIASFDTVQQQLQATNKLRGSINKDIASLLAVQFKETLTQAKWFPMSDIAPIVRRDVSVDQTNYAELGIRSFGKGTFHKPTLSRLDLGDKRVYRIEPGDLLFSNVFAWEGAIAVAQPEDIGRVGSHRFISCVPHDGLTTAEYLRYYFLTDEGMTKIRDASPGGAGRNRTLGLAKLMSIQVPIPSPFVRETFIALKRSLVSLNEHRQSQEIFSDALLPSLVNRLFSSEANV